MNRFFAGVGLVGSLMLMTPCEAATMRFECAEPVAAPAQVPDPSGSWDMVMDVGGTPSFGLLSVARAGVDLAGSIALNAGVVVVRSSRVATGMVDRNVEVKDDELGFVASDELNPQKARVLLGLALLKPGRKPADLQTLFQTY